MEPLVLSIRFAIVIAIISIIAMVLARNDTLGLTLSAVALGISVFIAVIGTVIVKRREKRK